MSIYDLIGEKKPEPLVPPAEFPLQLTHVGCGRHTFEKDEAGAYRCTNAGCATAVRPGQLLYDGLRRWEERNG